MKTLTKALIELGGNEYSNVTIRTLRIVCEEMFNNDYAIEKNDKGQYSVRGSDYMTVRELTTMYANILDNINLQNKRAA